MFRDLSFDLPRNGRLALFGRNGHGKFILIKSLGGVDWPTTGTIKWSMSCSWPLGLTGGFQGWMTDLDNIRFIALIYHRRAKARIKRVEEFAALGKALSMPLRYYSSGMRARIAFGLSIAIDFDRYLIDEVVAVGDSLFREKSEDELFGVRANRAVAAPHDLEFPGRNRRRAIVIESGRGRAKIFEDNDLAIEVDYAISEEGPRSAATVPHSEATA